MSMVIPVPLRVGAVIAAALVLQLSVVGRIGLFGVSGDLMVVVAVAAGYHAGPERGALIGFVAGLSIDLLLVTPLGLSALVLTGVGYISGLVATNLIRESRLMVVVLATALAPTAVGAWVLIGALFGQTHLLEAPLLPIGLVTALVALAAIGLVSPVVRWAVSGPHPRVGLSV